MVVGNVKSSLGRFGRGILIIFNQLCTLNIVRQSIAAAWGDGEVKSGQEWKEEN